MFWSLDHFGCFVWCPVNSRHSSEVVVLLEAGRIQFRFRVRPTFSEGPWSAPCLADLILNFRAPASGRISACQRVGSSTNCRTLLRRCRSIQCVSPSARRRDEGGGDPGRESCPPEGLRHRQPPPRGTPIP